MNIDSKSVVVISGASSGIGAALAIEFARMGASLALCARRQDRLHEVAMSARELGAEVFDYVCDVSVERGAKIFIEKCEQRFGRIDVLVNNAGRGNCASVEHTSEHTLQSIFGVNVFSLWYMTAPVLPIMRRQKGGAIISIASMAGKFGYPFNSAYVAAKHAVVGFTASLRAELVGTGITANVVCPSGVETEWASVSEDASIGTLFAEGIKRSRRISREKNIPFAPLKPMMTAEAAAQRIVRSLLDAEPNDVYTHDGTEEQAQLAAKDRSAFEQLMLPLYEGMQEAYTLLSTPLNS